MHESKINKIKSRSVNVFKIDFRAGSITESWSDREYARTYNRNEG